MKKTKMPLRLEWIEAGSLADNPENWRRHPQGQRRALKAVLDDVGWAGALLYNQTTGRLIDGHARKDAVPPQTLVPVLVGNWTPEQERKILATLDPLGAMAEADADALESVLAEVDLQEPELAELAALLDGLADDAAADGGEDPDRRRSRPAPEQRKRGPRVMGITIGQFHFEVPRQDYDAWLSALEAKTGSDVDQVVKELRRRLKL